MFSQLKGFELCLYAEAKRPLDNSDTHLPLCPRLLGLNPTMSAKACGSASSLQLYIELGKQMS